MRFLFGKFWLVFGFMLVPFVSQAQDASYYVGAGLIQDASGVQYYPVLAYEKGPFSIGLSEINYTVFDGAKLQITPALEYDYSDLDFTLLVNRDLNNGFYTSLHVGQSLNGGGSFISPVIGVQKSIGILELDFSAGAQYSDSARFLRDYSAAGLSGAFLPQVSVTFTLPFSPTVAVLGDVTLVQYNSALVGSGAVTGSYDQQISLFLVKQF